ncbi:MAG: hypothetical protein K1V95_00975, partial [Eubacterium sp.]
YNDIDDFKESLIYGREIEIRWKDTDFTIEYEGDSLNKFSICEAYKPETENTFKTVDELLDFKIFNESLRNIITKVEIMWRNI